MNTETKICQNCKAHFNIEPDDFSFYEKVKVPPPTFCPECRLIRRMMWRNERNLYRRPCTTATGEQELIANYDLSVPFPVYEQDYWWGDDWDAMDYGFSYDFTKPFFEQWRKLLHKVPQPHATNLQNTNSNYCNFTYQSKNCYLSFASDINEDSAYLHQSMKNKNSFDLEGCESMESSLMSYKSKGCYNSSYNYFSYNCIDSHLMWDCHNCTNCFGCVELRNKQNCIFNIEYSKEEYNSKIKEYLDGSYNTLKNNLEKFHAFTLTFPRKFSDILLSEKVTGNHIRNAHNCHDCFDIANKVDNCRFTAYAFSNTSDCYDLYAGGVNMELGYEIMAAGENSQNLFMSAMMFSSSDIYYSLFCNQSSNLFGCIGLQNKNYCIFNKQYTKEEYKELVPRIIEHMNEMPYVDVKGSIYKYGEFFPSEFSPFAYNETPAGDYYPLSREVATQKGFIWKEKEKNNYTVTLEKINIPDNMSSIDESIINEVIECEDKDMDYSPGAFRMIASEFNLYKKFNLPIPRKSPNARYYERLKYRNPYTLWHRKCMCVSLNHIHGDSDCSVEFETTYAKDRPETIYCEKCYQQEVM